MESGWKTVLGNAEESGLFLKKVKFPLKISERAWWLKVSLPQKRKSGVKGSGPAPMDLSTMNTGNTVNTDSTETKQTKRNTDCSCRSVAAVVPEDVVPKDLVINGTTDSDDDFMSCCEFETTDSDDDFMSCCGFCQDDHGTSGHMDWEYHVGRTGSVNLIGDAGMTGLLWTLVSGCCVVFFRWRT